jgi:hypothetical protein
MKPIQDPEIPKKHVEFLVMRIMSLHQLAERESRMDCSNFQERPRDKQQRGDDVCAKQHGWDENRKRVGEYMLCHSCVSTSDPFVESILQQKGRRFDALGC